MVLIVGASGRLGGTVTRLLLARAAPVRILLRRDSPAEQLAAQGLATSPRDLIAAGAQPVYGDLKDRASLDTACQGVEAVITTANSALRGGADSPQTVDWEGNRSLIDAALAAGVGQFIFVSAQIADAASPVPFLQAKGKTEEYLRESGVPYTIIAPAAFMDVWIAMVVGMPAVAGLPVLVAGAGERKHSFIAQHDVARFVVASLGHEHAINRRLVIGGPDALSFRDAARAFARVLGRDVPVESVQPGEPVLHLPEAMSRMLPGFEIGDTAVDTSDLAKAFGVELTTLDDFARRMTGTGETV